MYSTAESYLECEVSYSTAASTTVISSLKLNGTARGTVCYFETVLNVGVVSTTGDGQADHWPVAGTDGSRLTTPAASETPVGRRVRAESRRTDRRVFHETVEQGRTWVSGFFPARDRIKLFHLFYTYFMF